MVLIKSSASFTGVRSSFLWGGLPRDCLETDELTREKWRINGNRKTEIVRVALKM